MGKHSRKVTCPVCHGSKKISGGQDCPTCNGTGEVVQIN